MIGGGLVGCETALWLAGHGKTLTIVETLPEMASGICHANRVMLLDLLTDKHVELVNNASLEEVVDDGVVVIDTTSNRKTIKCDIVALAVGFEPCRELYESLRTERTEPYMIGDCQEPRSIMSAIHDGYHITCR